MNQGSSNKVAFALAFAICMSFVCNCSAIDSVIVDFQNDPNYPNMINIYNLEYKLISNQIIDVSADVEIKEKLAFGTKLQMSLSPDFPYASYVDKMDADICFFAKKEVPQYRSLLAASNFPDRCPIEAGIYSIRNYQIDLSKYPLLLQGFNVQATFTLHKGDRVLAKVIASCSGQ